MDEIVLKDYKEIETRWLMLIAEAYSDLDEEPKSVDEARAILDKHPDAKTVFEKRMADVHKKISLALSDAEDILQYAEQQIVELSDDDRPAIKKLKQRIPMLDMKKYELVGGCAGEPKDGIIPWPDKRPIRETVGVGIGDGSDLDVRDRELAHDLALL